ncbi:DUF1203 domain-containing protein [Streptomyces sp. NPDC053755]|uniref:DUF1203 domain-containing protein n=1 Tax=Streptomyces sp. NPDC053755 TaxID=3155815 RepID=UPI00343630E4
MTVHRARAIEPAALAELRVTDDAGRPCVPYVDEEGGDPLRCCLRAIRPGERVALVSYAPLRRWAAAHGVDPGAYDEQGPVFVHAGECAGGAGGAGGVRGEAGTGGAGGVRGAGGTGPADAAAPPAGSYPFARPGASRVLRRYGADGRILGGRLLELPEAATEAFDQALTETFADPDVALVHVRAVEYGCFHFEVRRGE